MFLWSRARPVREADNLAAKLVPEAEIKMFMGSRARPAREADNLAAICEPIV
jgi:hypothetical protein